MRGKFHRPQNRSAITEYTEKGLPKLCRKTQQNLESPLFQAFFSAYVPEKAFSVCIKVSVFIDPCCGSGGMFVQSAKFIQAHSGKRGEIAVYTQGSGKSLSMVFYAQTMPGKELLEIYKANGGKYVTIGSDAHVVEDIGADYTTAKSLLEEVGLQEASTCRYGTAL